MTTEDPDHDRPNDSGPHPDPAAETAGPSESPEQPSGDPGPAEPGEQGWQNLWSKMRSSAQSIADKAKEAATKAAQVTADITRETLQVTKDGAAETAGLARHTVTNFQEVRGQAGAAFVKVGKTVTDTSVGIAQSATRTIATASSEAVKALVNNMNEALPFIERAGYRVSEIELGLSVPPKIVMHLTLDDEISDEVRAALLKDCGNKWFTRQLIERLHDVRQIQRATQFVGMAFDEIEIEIALIPTVLLHYRKVHRAVPLPVASPRADAAQAAEDAAAAAIPTDPTAPNPATGQ